MTTGKKPASAAGSGLRNTKTTKTQREIDASDLAQASRKRSKSASKKGK